MTLEFERRIANVCSRVASRQGEHVRIKLRDALWSNRDSLQVVFDKIASGEFSPSQFELVISCEKKKLLDELASDSSLSTAPIPMLVTSLLFELAKESAYIN